MTNPPLPFTQLGAGVGSGTPAPAGWLPINVRPLLVFVGVTGAGKSTTLAALDEGGFACHRLPDRRDLTDRLIIPTVQAQQGETIAPVTDRTLRFAYTRSYRESHAGGMAHALTQLRIDPLALPDLLVFDGLRGEDEVMQAARLLPAARFVVLQAPDVVRVARLMGRGDPFDQIGGAASAGGGNSGANPRIDHVQTFADVGAPEAATLFTHLEEQALLELVRTGSVTAAALRAALTIVGEERRNYDPAAARAALLRMAPAHTLVVDTVHHLPEQVATQIMDFCSA